MDSTRYSSRSWWRRAAGVAPSLTLSAHAFAQDDDSTQTGDMPAYYTKGNVLTGRAVLPAATFTPGPTRLRVMPHPAPAHP